MLCKAPYKGLEKIVGPKLQTLLCLILSAESQDRNLATTTLKINHLHRAGDLVKISGYLDALDGVIGMRVDLDRGMLFISHQPFLPHEKIIEAVELVCHTAIVYRQLREAPADLRKRFFNILRTRKHLMADEDLTMAENKA